MSTTHTAVTHSGSYQTGLGTWACTCGFAGSGTARAVNGHATKANEREDRLAREAARLALREAGAVAEIDPKDANRDLVLCINCTRWVRQIDGVWTHTVSHRRECGF